MLIKMDGSFLKIVSFMLMLLTTFYNCENPANSGNATHIKENTDNEDSLVKTGYHQTSNEKEITEGEISKTVPENEVAEVSSEDKQRKLEFSNGTTESTLRTTESTTDSTENTKSTPTEAQSTQSMTGLAETTSAETEDTQATTEETETTPVETEDTQVTTETTPVETEDTQVATETTPVETEDTQVTTEETETTSVDTEDTQVTTETTPVETEDTQVTTETTPVETEDTQVTTEETETTSVETEDTQVTTETTPVETEDPQTTMTSTDAKPTSESPTENPSTPKLTTTQSRTESQSTTAESFSTFTIEASTMKTTLAVTTESNQTEDNTTETKVETTDTPTSPKDIISKSTKVEQSTLPTTTKEKKSICEPNPCMFGGNCTEVSETEYSCSCGEGLMGNNCEIWDSCVSDGAGGLCKNGRCAFALNHRIRYCECLPDFYFDFFYKECLHGREIGECIRENPCPQTTDCLNTKEGYSCVCKRGYILANYFSIPEKDGCVELCNPNPCVHGECNVTERNTFNCSCETGYTGDFCEEVEGQTTYVDACAKDNPCPDTTECLNIKGNYTCRCKNGYRLASSSSDAIKDGCVELCNPNPCVHGKCRKYGATLYHCSCESGYIGAFCDKENAELKKAKKTSVVVGTLLGIFLIVTIIILLETFRRMKKKKPDEDTTELFYGSSEMEMNDPLTAEIKEEDENA